MHEIKLLIVDVELPDFNGFEFAEQVLKINKNQNIFFLTARNDKDDRLRGLKIGAMDYIGKPFDIDELILKIGNSLERYTLSSASIPAQSILQIGDIRYNKDQLLLQFNNEKSCYLTLRESELLVYLFSHVNQLVKKNDILLQLWGDTDYFNGKSLEVFISRLRKLFKLSNQVRLENIYGAGYILKVEGL